MTRLKRLSLEAVALAHRECAAHCLAELARCSLAERAHGRSGRMVPIWIRRAKQRLRKARRIEALLRQVST